MNSVAISFASILCCVLLAGNTLSGCGEEVAPAQEGLWPMAVGNKWVGTRLYFNVHDRQVGAERETFTIVGSELIDGEWWFRFDDGGFRTNRADGVWWRRSASAQPMLIAKYPTSVGDTFRLEILPDSDSDGDTTFYWSETEGTGVMVKVVYGTFPCWIYKDHFRNTEIGWITEHKQWDRAYTPDYGPIRIVSGYTSFGSSDTSYYRWQLSYAELK